MRSAKQLNNFFKAIVSRQEFSFKLFLIIVFSERAINPWSLLKHMGSDRFSCFAIVFSMWSVVLLIIRKQNLYRTVAFNANVFSAFQKKNSKTA